MLRIVSSALRYTDRATEESRPLRREDIFVQIGLLSNTDWLSPPGRNRNRPSRPDLRTRRLRGGRLHDHPLQADHHRHGGEGTKASRSACDYLIRNT
jgi:alkyl hydroperoxide reductase subunit AhpF